MVNYNKSPPVVLVKYVRCQIIDIISLISEAIMKNNFLLVIIAMLAILFCTYKNGFSERKRNKKHSGLSFDITKIKMNKTNILANKPTGSLDEWGYLYDENVSDWWPALDAGDGDINIYHRYSPGL